MTRAIQSEAMAIRHSRSQVFLLLAAFIADALGLRWRPFGARGKTVIFRNLKNVGNPNSLSLSHLQKSISVIYGFPLVLFAMLLALPSLGQTNVWMLVPGFTVRELPVKLSNINNLRFNPEGKLTALGYDGRVHILHDSDSDG